MKKILIDLGKGSFDYSSGGVSVQFELCKILCEFGVNAKIKSTNAYQNNICNNYYNDDFPIDNDVVVIYGETIWGNPLNAPNVVRWILAPIGMNITSDIVESWGKKDLVYYFNSEEVFKKNPEKNGTIYKMLSTLFINPDISNYNFECRTGTCYTTRKGEKIHGSNLKMIHPKNSFELTYSHTQNEYIKFFNKYKWFVCYDPLTFMAIIAALCGCVPVIYKIEGLTKKEWIETTAAAEYIKHKNIDNLYGIAYGQEDMEYALETIHLVKEQWDEILNFNKKKTIVPFIGDMKNFEDLQNTIENNYFVKSNK